MQTSFITFLPATPRSSSSLRHICTSRQPPLQTRKRSRSHPAMILQVLWQTALSTGLYQATFFTVSFIKKFDLLTDFAGTTNFIVVCLQSFLQAPSNIRSNIATSFVTIWATRLGGFLLYRILKWGRDRRFDKTRDNFKMLALFWSVQAVWVWIVSLPVTLLNGSPHASILGGVDYIGWGLFMCGFLIESVADVQKLNHKMKSDKWVDTGLWRYSRHPNYFGEIMVWFGVYLSCVGGLRGLQHLAVVSPIFISGFLVFVSGIPILEKSADYKHGNTAEYVEYKRNTSVLVPCPSGIYRRLPTALRQTVFLELGMYDNVKKQEGRAKIVERRERSE